MPVDLSLQIDVVKAEDLTPEDFHKNYFMPQKPLLIKGLANQQPAGTKWTLDFFRENAGHENVTVFDDRNKAHKNNTYFKGDHKIKLREYLNIIEKDEYTPLRMFAFDLFKLQKELKKDFSCPAIFKGFLDHLGYFFMGGKNSIVRLHFDVDYNNVLLTQFHGKKRIVLIDPKYSALLYRLPYATHSIMNFAEPDYEKFPGLHYVKGYSFVQEAGDALFMPAHWWHYIVYLEGAIAISYRKMHRNPFKNIQGILSIGLLLPFDKMMTQVFKEKWFDYKCRILNKRAAGFIKIAEEGYNKSYICPN